MCDNQNEEALSVLIHLTGAVHEEGSLWNLIDSWKTECIYNDGKQYEVQAQIDKLIEDTVHLIYQLVEKNA